LRNAYSLDDKGDCRNETERPEQETQTANESKEAKWKASNAEEKSTKAEKIDRSVL